MTDPIEIRSNQVRRPIYGRFLEDFAEGQVFAHPRGLTILPEAAVEFAQTFHEANPLYLNEPFARAHGYAGPPVSPLLVLNVTLSLGVQNDSEQAMAHLGYYDVWFPRPVYPGDTLRSFTKVLGKRERGPGKPGIVHVRTTSTNQRGDVVCTYERKIMIPCRPAGVGPTTAAAVPPQGWPKAQFPEFQPAPPRIPAPPEGSAYPRDLTGHGAYFEDFRPGDVILHSLGRTITQEHFAWTYRVGNTHPLHFDRLYTSGREGPLSGEPVVYGGLVFAWIAGLASRDTTENAIYDLGWTEGYHTQPSVAGDTLTAVSRVLSGNDWTGPQKAGVVRFQLVGLKNLKPDAALERYGPALFARELDKKEKIPEKVFEIERTVLLKKR